MSKEIYIFGAKRSPIGAFLGDFSDMHAHEIGAQVIKNMLKEQNLHPDAIQEVVIGQVLTASAGQNPARQAAIKAGIPVTKPAFSINHVCGSGLKSVVYAYLNIHANQSDLILAGGQENMSLTPHAIHLRREQKMGDAKLIDLMVYDGLTDAFNQYHMGITAENLAEKYGISRAEQDQFAYESISKAKKAQENGKFLDEIASITIKNHKGEEKIIDKDEMTKLNFDLTKLAKMRPAFKKENGSVTAGNSSSINDGAAFVLAGNEKMIEKCNLQPMAKIVAFAESGVDPAIMGIGPIAAIKKALQKANWRKDEVDLFEINEAFAVQGLAVMHELNLDQSKVNVNGGAIVLGHPIGSSGTRCLVSLLYEMKRQNLKKGLVSLCIGGGMGIAMCVELYK